MLKLSTGQCSIKILVVNKNRKCLKSYDRFWLRYSHPFTLSMSLKKKTELNQSVYLRRSAWNPRTNICINAAPVYNISFAFSSFYSLSHALVFSLFVQSCFRFKYFSMILNKMKCDILNYDLFVYLCIVNIPTLQSCDSRSKGMHDLKKLFSLTFSKRPVAKTWLHMIFKVSFISLKFQNLWTVRFNSKILSIHNGIAKQRIWESFNNPNPFPCNRSASF